MESVTGVQRRVQRNPQRLPVRCMSGKGKHGPRITLNCCRCRHPNPCRTDLFILWLRIQNMQRALTGGENLPLAGYWLALPREKLNICIQYTTLRTIHDTSQLTPTDFLRQVAANYIGIERTNHRRVFTVQYSPPLFSLQLPPLKFSGQSSVEEINGTFSQVESRSWLGFLVSVNSRSVDQQWWKINSRRRRSIINQIWRPQSCGLWKSCPALEYKYAAFLSDENMAILHKWLIFGYQEIVAKKSILAG